MIKREKRSQVSLGYWPLSSHSWHSSKYDLCKICLSPNMFLALVFLLSGIAAILPTITARDIRDQCMCDSKSSQSARSILVTFCSVPS